MAITDYTTPDEVRSALSVNSTELPDDEILLPLVEQRLSARMYSISDTIEDRYVQIKATPEIARTKNMTRFLAATDLLYTYAVAVDFTPTLGTLMTRMLTDGKAEQQRFDKVVEDTVAGIVQMYEMVRNRALAWLEVVDSGLPPVVVAPVQEVFFVAVGVAVDPVTGV